MKPKEDMMSMADAIAHRGWNKNTANSWKSRGQFAKPDLVVAGREFWSKKTIDAFVAPGEKRRGAK